LFFECVSHRKISGCRASGVHSRTLTSTNKDAKTPFGAN
jgi:hypothetical protein